jgi:hypothetical protein
MQYSEQARLLVRAKEIRDDGSVFEMVVWYLPAPILPCSHCCKYRLHLGAGSATHVRCDDERGKGDHRHVGLRQEPYFFPTLQRLLSDFGRDVEEWSNR